jgi:hypothetical protein
MTSSEPSENHQPENGYGEKRESTSSHKRASAAALMEAFARQYEQDRKVNRRSERHRTFREYLTIGGLFLSAVVAGFQWRELRSTDHHIDEQARIAARQLTVLENDKRPWISAGVSISNVSVTEWAGSRGIDVPLKFTLKNHGQAPAVNVRAYQTISIHPGNPRREELSVPQKAICESAGAESDKNPIGGIAIFPSETGYVETAISISGGQIYQDREPVLFSRYSVALTTVTATAGTARQVSGLC